MFVSYNWLQRYFKKKLPTPEKVVEILTFSAFEIESIEQKGDDFVLDVKVLPDRACYALSHRGIARELSAVLTWKLDSQVTWESSFQVQIPQAKTSPLSIKIENPADCRRYIGRRVEHVAVGLLQNAITEKLEAIGQRSINHIVNVANFVMFDMGQPLHAFDADKVKGGIMVRRAKKGERIATLDDKNLELDLETLVIADDEGLLAIAGIKGGKRAEVTEKTKNLILESANFNPELIRRTSERLGIRTDASKRFENNPSADFAEKGMAEFSSLLKEMVPDAKFGETVDVYPSPEQSQIISTSVAAISLALGVTISSKKVTDILSRLGIVAKESKGKLTLTIPIERRDLFIPEDIVEEVGRLYGYDKVPTEKLPRLIGGQAAEKKAGINKNFYWENQIRQTLINLGFSEIVTSSFCPKGDLEIEKPLASDKAFLRTQLATQLVVSLKFNTLNAPLLGLKEIKIFEIGKVFPKSGEETHLAFNDFAQTKTSLEKILGEKIIGQARDGILEINLDGLIKKLPAPTARLNLAEQRGSTLRFQQISPYPFIVRDIAVFVPIEITAEKLWQAIEKGIGQEKNLLANHYLFDEYQKAGKKSLAFRLVFQAPDRTLTDIEINKIMEKVSAAVSQNNWQVR